MVAKCCWRRNTTPSASSAQDKDKAEDKQRLIADDKRRTSADSADSSTPSAVRQSGYYEDRCDGALDSVDCADRNNGNGTLASNGRRLQHSPRVGQGL
jgi:hypothetical protein